MKKTYYCNWSTDIDTCNCHSFFCNSRIWYINIDYPTKTQTIIERFRVSRLYILFGGSGLGWGNGPNRYSIQMTKIFRTGVLWDIPTPSSLWFTRWALLEKKTALVFVWFLFFFLFFFFFGRLAGRSVSRFNCPSVTIDDFVLFFRCRHFGQSTWLAFFIISPSNQPCIRPCFRFSLLFFSLSISFPIL